MRKIEFIPGILAMRGNLSGNQKVGYPLQGGAAYDAPEGVNHATAYRPSYIGAKRAKDGLTYFAVKTKQTVNITPEARLKWAVLAACSIIYSKALTLSGGEFKRNMNKLYQTFKAANPSSPRSRSMRAYFYPGIEQMVVTGDTEHMFEETINGHSESLKLFNCFALEGESQGIAVLPVDQFIKFGTEVWSAMDTVVGGAKFTIDGLVKGSPMSLDDVAVTWVTAFGADTAFVNPNWANITDGIEIHQTATPCVTYQNHVLYLGDTKVLPSDALVAGAKYVTKEAYSA